MAKIGILRKAMVNHGISVESAPTSNKQKEPAVVKLNGKFAGITKKKNRSSSVVPSSLVEQPITELNDSDN